MGAAGLPGKLEITFIQRMDARRLDATLARGAFDSQTHETAGYKLAFQPDISDMISASRLVSLLFVSFLPRLL